MFNGTLFDFDFVTIRVSIPCALKYFIITTFHIFQSHGTIPVCNPGDTVKIPC